MAKLLKENTDLEKLVLSLKQNVKEKEDHMRELEDENRKLISLNDKQNGIIQELTIKVTSLSEKNNSKIAELCDQIKKLEMKNKLSENKDIMLREKDKLIKSLKKQLKRQTQIMNKTNSKTIISSKNILHEDKETDRVTYNEIIDELQSDNKIISKLLLDEREKCKKLEQDIIGNRSISEFISNGFMKLSNVPNYKQKLRTKLQTYVFWDLENVSKYNTFKDYRLDNITIFGFIGKLHSKATWILEQYNIMKYLVESIRKDACDTYMIVHITRLLERVIGRVNIIIISRDHFVANLVDTLSVYKDNALSEVFHVTTADECHTKLLVLG